MAKKMIATQMKLKPGSFVRVVGDIASPCKRFSIDLGSDEDNLAIHFNPRFHFAIDRKKIVFNSRVNGYYGYEIRDSHFPFEMGNRTEVKIKFEGTSFLVTLSDGYRITFPNRTNIRQIDRVAVAGDIVSRSLAFE